MRIAILSSYVPFIQGGARNIVDWLDVELRRRNHEVEVIYIPFAEIHEEIFTQFTAFQSIDLTDYADLVITFRPPAHLIEHPRKVAWFIHHIRSYYDLWESEYRGFPITEISESRRSLIHQVDTLALQSSHRVFANSAVVAKRIQDYNQISAQVLYPPVIDPERFWCAPPNDEVVMVARIEEHKRQHLLIEALAYTKSPIRVRFIGATSNPSYVARLQQLITELNVKDRVFLENVWSSEEDKAEALAHCLANIYFPLDEDSYGYSTIEAAWSSKATLTTTDSGGVSEFVVDGQNGLICEATPQSVAQRLDMLFGDRTQTEQMGVQARDRILELGIDWDSTIEKLLS